MPKTDYLVTKKLNRLPRLPLEGMIDLTYRCNNNCRHCWVRIPPDSSQQKEELSFNEIIGIIKQAKELGCRHWSISGGEPMLRADFVEIFDYITKIFPSYSINTNGTFITPKIAQLMKRKGNKMVALYGATSEVHDKITRRAGSFEEAIRGFSYLKEAGAGFTVQIIPMKDNYFQFKEMINLAKSLSKSVRIGASWLYLSAYHDKKKNEEIKRQRLPAKQLIEIDKPDISYSEWYYKEYFEQNNHPCLSINKDRYLFYRCISNSYMFYINPYGKMTFCSYVNEPSLMFDLRRGSFKYGWEEFIPSLATKIKATEEYKNNCGSCRLRTNCFWCPAYGYLEKGDFNARVEYLCDLAAQKKEFEENWKANHRRFFKIADIIVQVDSDLPFSDKTFHPKFKKFQTSSTDGDKIFIRHHFSLPDLNGKDLGRLHYKNKNSPWAIYKKNDSWIYLEISPESHKMDVHKVAVFSNDYTRARIYNQNEHIFSKGNLTSLTFFPTDQLILSQVLADRGGCYIHSCGVNFNGKGLLFLGESGAGKSTMAKLFRGKAEILCDDRIIIRRQKEGIKIYGTWSNGEVPDVSSNFAILQAIIFLEKAQTNKLIPLEEKREIIKRFLSCVVRPFVTADWWQKIFLLINQIIEEVPFYIQRFNNDGKIIDILKKL